MFDYIKFIIIYIYLNFCKLSYDDGYFIHRFNQLITQPLVK